MIASLLWPSVTSWPASSSVHVNLGDLPTWLLAVVAVGALVAAIAAYRKQSSSDDHLAEQVRLQGEALEDQQAVNVLQGKMLERTLGALTRQQAEQIDVEHIWHEGDIAGGRTGIAHRHLLAGETQKRLTSPRAPYRVPAPGGV